MIISSSLFKDVRTANPVSACRFCADPFAIEYEGRLYLYGTNDQQQYIENRYKGNNTYEKINSLVCFSTDDMINWTFHGEIDVKKAAPWVLSSWAPCVIYRKGNDGKTHFYLYFSNSGCGVGVLTSESPVGPWSSPLNKPLINFDMKDIGDVPNPFDPGACIDCDGNGYLVFGGGIAKGCDESFPGTVRIVKLGKDFVSVENDFVQIPAPYFFEASDLYYMNGTFVYSYNTNWVERKYWNLPESEPSPCCMSYMTTKTPMDGASWKYQSHYLKNPGEMGFNYSNNHACLVKFKGKHYIFYHTLMLQDKKGISGGFRSICADSIDIDEKNACISMASGTREGVQADGKVCPFKNVHGSLQFTSADIDYFKNNGSVSLSQGAWILIRNVDFEQNACELIVTGSGHGSFSFFTDKMEGEPAAVINVDSEVACTLSSSLSLTGVHDFYIVMSTAGLKLDKWFCRANS